MQDFRRLMLDAVSGTGVGRAAVLMSGGVDSTCVLLACLDAGIEVTAYTFHLAAHESQDAKASRRICSDLGVRLTEVVVPYSLDALEADVRRIVRTFGTTRKTAVQCIHPFLYVVESVSEDDAFSGLYADDLWGTSRKGAQVARTGRRAFRAYREAQLAQTDYSCAHIAKLFASHGKRLHMPFASTGVSRYLLGLTWDEMNRPRPKALAVRAYPEYFTGRGWYRRNSNLQVNSGIREYHDLLLRTGLNTRGLKSVRGIYNDIAKGVV